MSAYNFKAQFAELVESGKKRQTIRAMRKHMPKVGERVHLFTGMRTKACRRLRAGHEDRHKAVRLVTIRHKSVDVGVGPLVTLRFDSDLNEFARRDGFNDWPEMRDFFRREHGLPFHGFLVEW